MFIFAIFLTKSLASDTMYIAWQFLLPERGLNIKICRFKLELKTYYFDLCFSKKYVYLFLTDHTLSCHNIFYLFIYA